MLFSYLLECLLPNLLHRKELPIRGQNCVLDITDLSDQEQFSFPDEISGADGVLLVYSITDHRSFEKIPLLSSEVRSLANSRCYAVVATKLDLAGNRWVSIVEGEKTSHSAGSDVRGAFEGWRRRWHGSSSLASLPLHSNHERRNDSNFVQNTGMGLGFETISFAVQKTRFGSIAACEQRETLVFSRSTTAVNRWP
jgi:GTPase SAR1 family protein